MIVIGRFGFIALGAAGHEETGDADAFDTARAVWPPLRRSGRFPALPYPPQRL
jgi:hypothetical protein